MSTAFPIQPQQSALDYNRARLNTRHRDGINLASLEMPIGLKNAWVAALRGGAPNEFQYVQGQSRLCNVNFAGTPVSWCCLGVVCDLAKKGYFDEGGMFHYKDKLGAPTGEAGGMMSFPSYYRYTEILGLRHVVPELRGTDEEKKIVAALYGHLSAANDAQVPWAEIADWIEENIFGYRG